jgi:hypothetical protein
VRSNTPGTSWLNNSSSKVAGTAAGHSIFALKATSSSSPYSYDAQTEPSPSSWLGFGSNLAAPRTPAAVLAAAAATAQDTAAVLGPGAGLASAASRLKAVRMQQAAAGAGRLQQQLQAAGLG